MRSCLQREEDLSDWLDEANELTEMLFDVAQKNRAAKIELMPVSFNGADCIDCEEPVEPPRLTHGFFRCYECQTIKERRERLG